MPFMIEPMACSLTPKCRFLPMLPGRKSPIPLRCVLVDGARSAEPPMRKGAPGAIAFNTLPEAWRVAIGPSFSVNDGRAPVHAIGFLPPRRPSISAASSGYSLR